MSILFVPLERRVAALSPTPRIVAMAVRTANIINLADEVIRGIEYAVEELHLMHDPVGATFLGSPIISQEDQNGVL